MSEKKLSEKEILRQQLELLAEWSKRVSSEELPGLTAAMVQIYSFIAIPQIGTTKAVDDENSVQYLRQVAEESFDTAFGIVGPKGTDN